MKLVKTWSPFATNPLLSTLGWRLLLSSLGVICCTVIVFSLVVYQVVAHTLERRADRRLKLLGDAAIHSLAEIKANPNRIHPSNFNPSNSKQLDDDGDLDLPWQSLQQAEQGLEWFDEKGQLLGRSGSIFASQPASQVTSQPASQQKLQGTGLERPDEAFLEQEGDRPQDDQLHVLTLPAYQKTLDAKTLSLIGYVRVSESSRATQEELKRLRLGLQSGSLLALVLSGLGSWWLTRQSLQPIARSLEQLKQFTADASHELRNPLTAIKLSTEVLQSRAGSLEPSDQEKLAAIASATGQMGQLIDDLLWLARSDRERPGISQGTIIPVEELLEELVDQFLLQAEQQQIEFVANIRTPASIVGNPSQLKRLLGNLIANALQYTPSGGQITLAVQVDGPWVTLQVKDTGIGIEPEHLAHVFDRFWRADQARAYREGGTGLGLAIAQVIAHRHQGEITVQSRLGQGSCFQISLPTV